MKFKAQFTDRGLRALERGFLPTLDKLGKTCHVLLGPDDVHFVQTPLNTDGMRVTARFNRDVLFNQTDFKCTSAHFNLIAIQVELPLLLRVMRGAGTNNADSLEVRLSIQTVPPSNQSKPVLKFSGKGHSVSMEQVMPIAELMNARGIDKLVQIKEVSVLCDYYLDIGPALQRLQVLVDRMKTLGNVLTLALTKGGDLHMRVGSAAVSLGIQIQDLRVFPESVTATVPVDRTDTAEEQLRAAEAAGDAVPVVVQLKHMAKVLKVSHITSPAQILCGIGQGGTYVHIMFVFRDASRTDAVYDDNIGLSFQLPVRDDD